MRKKFKTDDGEFVLRKYEEQDQEEVLKLWKAAFKHEMSPAMWRWKYLDNPYEENLLLCESETKQLLAFYGGIPFKANRNGKSVVIVQLMDIMSHPDVRGKGLFVRTGKAFFEFFCTKDGAELLYGFPGAFHFDLGRRILDYSPLADKVVCLQAETDKLAAKEIPGLKKMRKIEHPGDEFNNLWYRCRKSYPYSVVRDLNFVKWRFADHPQNRSGEKYEIWCIKGMTELISRKIHAYAVISVSKDTAILVDMLCPESGKDIALFFAKLGKMLKLRGISRIRTWFPGNHFLKNAAVTAGFKVVDEPLGIIATVRCFDHSPDPWWINDNLFYTMADADLF